MTQAGAHESDENSERTVASLKETRHKVAFTLASRSKPTVSQGHTFFMYIERTVDSRLERPIHSRVFCKGWLKPVHCGNLWGNLSSSGRLK